MINLKQVSVLVTSTINSVSKHSNITYFKILTRNETVIYQSLSKLMPSEKDKGRLLIILSNRFSIMCSQVLGEALHNNAHKLNKACASEMLDWNSKHLCRNGMRHFRIR